MESSKSRWNLENKILRGVSLRKISQNTILTWKEKKDAFYTKCLIYPWCNWRKVVDQKL